MMEEMAKRFGLSRHQLQMLQEAGVFTQEDERVVAQWISLALSLDNLGISGEELRDVLALYHDPLRNQKELLLCLRRQRGIILEALHAQNRRLDEIDYLIETLRRLTAEHDSSTQRRKR